MLFTVRASRKAGVRYRGALTPEDHDKADKNDYGKLWGTKFQPRIGARAIPAKVLFIVPPFFSLLIFRSCEETTNNNKNHKKERMQNRRLNAL